VCADFHIQLDIITRVNVSDLIRTARRGAGFTQTELARRSGTSQATISAYEHGAKTPAPDTLARVLAAAGMRLVAVPASSAVRVPGAGELERRGRILSQVLDLAERLPAKRRPTLRFPRLPAPTGA
jgi:transcriptional regulator with XRE-family HTH domain